MPEDHVLLINRELTITKPALFVIKTTSKIFVRLNLQLLPWRGKSTKNWKIIVWRASNHRGTYLKWDPNVAPSAAHHVIMHGRHTWLIDASVHKETRVRWPSIRRFITWIRQPVRAFVVHHESPSRCDQSESVEYPTVGIHYPFRRRRGDFVGGIPRRSFCFGDDWLVWIRDEERNSSLFPQQQKPILYGTEHLPLLSLNFELLCVWGLFRLGSASASLYYLCRCMY